MQRLKLPKMAAGKEFLTVPIKVNAEGPFEFMIDTALTAELISPHLQKVLDIADEKGEAEAGTEAGTTCTVEGLAAGGSKGLEKLVTLEGASLTTEDGHELLKLPSLHAVVSSFPQESIDPAHRVEGMLGIEMLEQYDVDLDFPAGLLRLWPAGTGAAVARRAGMVEIPAAIVSDTLLLAIRVRSASEKQQQQQPFVGIIDCGSSFTAVNWEAARLLGLPTNKLTYLAHALGSPTIMAVGVDGKPLPLPTREVALTFAGEARQDDKAGGMVHFDSPPEEWTPWDKVRVGIGDLPIFSLALGDPDHPFKGPAAIIGLDILSQRRMIIETCTGTLHCNDRRRRVFVEPRGK